jgi:hypothetical protein
MRVGRWGRLVSIGGCLAAVIAASACGSDDAVVADGAETMRAATPSIDLVRFTDVAADVGLDFRHGAFQWETSGDPAAMMGGGLCWIDYDRDGWLDLYAVNTWSNGEWGRWREQGELPASRLFRNDAGRFVDVSDETGARVETRGNGCLAADLDDDGWTDLFITTDRDDVLLWNDGGERFVDDTTLEVPSGAATYGWHSGAAAGDVDGNGWPDLYVAGYADVNRPIAGTSKGFPNTFEPEPDLLFLNQGPVRGGRVSFREVASEAGIEAGGADYGLGATFTDVDRDGDLDLFVAHDTTPNRLYENVSPPDGSGAEFVERGVEAGVGDTGAGMGVASSDLDLDGLPDLVVTNQLDERNVINLNRSGSTLAFVDGLEIAGVADFGVGSTGWGAVAADLDLDRDVDLAVANGAIPVSDLTSDRQQLVVLETTTDGARDVSELVGSGLDSYLGRGLAAADFDNDGDVDLALGTIGGDLALLRNDGAGGHWLEVAMATPVPGAVVRVELDDGTVIEREMQVGGSYLSTHDPRAHVGLGAAVDSVDVIVRFPDGSELAAQDVSVDRILQFEPSEAS